MGIFNHSPNQDDIRTGNKGPKGDKGDKGDRGLIGSKGDKGDNGNGFKLTQNGNHDIENKKID